jgi:Inner membrane protein YgaP-like, transmembrane domain
MQINEGSIDRAIRIVVGIMMLSFVMIGPHSLWGLFGLVPLLTGIWGYCPLYRVLGVTTCPRGPARAA